MLNFSAGPSTLPISVLRRIQADLINYDNSGMSVMEMSHRSATIEQGIVQPLIRNLYQLIGVNERDYELLLCQGGGTGQFAAWILNCLPDLKKCTSTQKEAVKLDFVVTGSWSQKALEEARLLVGSENVNAVVDTKSSGHTGHLPPAAEWKWSQFSQSSTKKRRFVYYCDNETIHGVEFPLGITPLDASLSGFKQAADEEVHLICDMSSNFLSRPIPNPDRFSLIFAGAQKNIGIAGLTIVLIKKQLLNLDWDSAMPRFAVPNSISYSQYAANGSMYHTPPVFAIYVAKLISDWILKEEFIQEEQQSSSYMGTTPLEKMAHRNNQKAALLYTYLDTNGKDGHVLFKTAIPPSFRSKMTIPVLINSSSKEEGEKLMKEFLEFAKSRGLVELKGHRSVGGLRMCLYNAMDFKSVNKLVEVMEEYRLSVNSKK